MPTVSGLHTVFHSPAIQLEPGAVFAERYEVIRTLGQGGMGVVYLVRDTTANVDVVLKLIHPALVADPNRARRLIAEGLMAREIRHPNVVSVYDVSQTRDQAYLTMEFVQGRTLRAWLEEQVRLDRDVPLDLAVTLIKGILAGLSEAHRMGVVHRDLKPENVMLKEGADGSLAVKILDFGIARAAGGPSTTSGARGSSSGTAVYAAPEQATSTEGIRPATDLFAVAVILYEMLMQVAPHRWEPINPSRPDVPAALDTLLERSLSARPRNRPQSTAEFEQALDAAIAPAAPVHFIPTPTPPPTPDPPVVVHQPAPPVPPPAPPPPPVSPVRTSFWRKPEGILTGLGAVALVLVVILNWPRPKPAPFKPTPTVTPSPTFKPTPTFTPRPTPAPTPRYTPPPPAAAWYAPLLGRWLGNYMCQGGVTGIDLRFYEVNANHVDATVMVFMMNPAIVPSTMLVNRMPTMSARYHVDRSGNGFRSHFEEWVNNFQQGVSWLPISGTQTDSRSITGQVEGCGRMVIGRQ